MRASTLATALALLACAEPPPPAETPIRPVRAEVVQVQPGQRVRSFPGTSRAGAEARLSFRVSGAVTKLHVKVGDQVKAGDPIAEIEPTDYKLQVQEAQANLANARAQERNAKATYQRTKKLYENQSASLAQLDQARAASESARAQARSVQQRIGLLRQQLKYTKLKAPSDGAIAAVEVENNENVSAGQPVAMLATGGKPEVVVAVPEALISEVQAGEKVEAHFDALGKALPGSVAEVGVTSTGARTTFPVTIRLEEGDPRFRPGMAADVRFVFGKPDAPPRLFVPPVAVGEDREDRFVFVVDGLKGNQGTVKRIDVDVGEIDAEGLEITGGLEGGEILVTAGLRYLQPGTVVKVPAEVLAEATDEPAAENAAESAP